MRVVYPFRVWEDGGSFIVEGLPPFDNVTTYGDDLPGAKAAAEEALTGVLGAMLDHGQPIPDPAEELPSDNVILVEPAAKVALPILLRKARESAGLSQGDLASRLGVTYQAIQKLERSGANPTVATVERVFRRLGRRIDLVLE